MREAKHRAQRPVLAHICAAIIRRAAAVSRASTFDLGIGLPSCELLWFEGMVAKFCSLVGCAVSDAITMVRAGSRASKVDLRVFTVL